MGGVGWEAIACQAITRFIVALCSSPSMLVASLRPLRGPSGIDGACAQRGLCACVMASHEGGLGGVSAARTVVF